MSFPAPPPPAQAAPAAAQQEAQAQAQVAASSSLNVAIQDSRDFPGEPSAQELYSEFTMADGRVLFECSALVKATGIDLMNCPLDVVLKLRVRKKTAQSSVVLWHVVLPLQQISKNLLNPPHEWETWIGLFPHTQSLEAHTPDIMFTQAVHLISRPEFPKLRLRFTYHNPELQAQISARCEMEQQESRRRTELTQKVGRQQFEEIHKLTRGLRGDGPPEREGSSPAEASRGTLAASAADHTFETPATPTRQAAPIAPSAARGEGSPASASVDDLCEALSRAMAFINSVHHMLSLHPRRGPGAPELPPMLRCEEVLRSSPPGPSIDAHCLQLHQCLCAVAYADSPAKATPGPAGTETETERLLAEGLRMALLGLWSDDAEQPQSLARLRSRSPGLSDALREVAAVVRERAGLLEQLGSRERTGAGPPPRRPVERPPMRAPEAAAGAANEPQRAGREADTRILGEPRLRSSHGT